MERLKTSIVSINNGNIKGPIRKSIFDVNLPIKLFRGIVAYADIWSLKSLHAFLKRCLYHILVKFEQNHMVQTKRNFELFDKNWIFWNQFCQSVDAILEDVSVTETIV